MINDKTKRILLYMMVASLPGCSFFLLVPAVHAVEEFVQAAGSIRHQLCWLGLDKGGGVVNFIGKKTMILLVSVSGEAYVFPGFLLPRHFIFNGFAHFNPSRRSV